MLEKPTTPTALQDLADLIRPPRQPSLANPRPITPNSDPREHPLANPAASLVELLGPTVDQLRQIATDLGARPYRVFSVVTRWSGGADGVGVEELVRETEWLPTPKVDGLPLGSELTSAGQQETGHVLISEISPRYTEQQIQYAIAPTDLGSGELAWIEVRMDSRDGSAPTRRRLVVSDVPWRDAEGFEWRAKATVQRAPRSRAGALTEPTLYPPRVR